MRYRACKLRLSSSAGKDQPNSAPVGLKLAFASPCWHRWSWRYIHNLLEANSGPSLKSSLAGVLCQRVQRDPPNPHNSPQHSSPIADMARKHLLPDHRSLPPSLWPPRRHLRRLPCVSLRPCLVYSLVTYWRVQPQLFDVELLPSTTGTWTCCLPSRRCLITRKYLSSWTKEKYCL